MSAPGMSITRTARGATPLRPPRRDALAAAHHRNRRTGKGTVGTIISLRRCSPSHAWRPVARPAAAASASGGHQDAGDEPPGDGAEAETEEAPQKGAPEPPPPSIFPRGLIKGFEAPVQLFRDWELRRGRLQSPGSRAIGQLWGPSALLPCGVIAAAASGMLCPEAFSQAPLELYALSMGFLSFVIALDFRLRHYIKAASSAKDVAVGMLCHWAVVPLVGAVVGATVVPAMQLPGSLGLGIMMASFLPASAISCFACWVAHPNMAPLSVVLAASSMLLSAAFTPLLASNVPAALLKGSSAAQLASLSLDPKAMAVTTAQIILLPTAAGLLLGAVARPLVQAIKPLLSFLALVDVCICTAVVASASSPILAYSWAASAMVPMAAVQLGSMCMSYYIARVSLNSIARAKCISLSAGMPAALLGTFLLDRFAKDSVAALGCSLYIPVMLIAGLGMAQRWRPARPS